MNNKDLLKQIETIDNILRDIRGSISESHTKNCETLQELQEINNNIIDIKYNLEKITEIVESLWRIICWEIIIVPASLIIHKIFG